MPGTPLHCLFQPERARDSQKFGMDMFLRKRWKDPRLVYEDGPPSIHLSPEVAQKYLWIPDLFFPNARESTISKTLKPDYGVRVDQEGNVLMSMRSISQPCSTNFRLGWFVQSVHRGLHSCQSLTVLFSSERQ